MEIEFLASVAVIAPDPPASPLSGRLSGPFLRSASSSTSPTRRR